MVDELVDEVRKGNTHATIPLCTVGYCCDRLIQILSDPQTTTAANPAEELDSYYAVLGCAETATVRRVGDLFRGFGIPWHQLLVSTQTEQIRAEYYARARALHPDKNTDGAGGQTDDSRATDRFSRLQQAYSALTDPKSRADYDTWVHSGIRVPYERWRQLGLSGGMVGPARRVEL